MKPAAGPLAAASAGAGAPVVRWGIIGVGDVCEVKSGPAFQKAPGSSLVAVMRRNGTLAESFARRHGVPRWYTDAAALLEDDEVDAVYIATPPETHRDYVLLCCAKGKPCLVEKPMARSAAECREMIAAFRQRELPLFVAYYRRHLPKFEAVRALLEEGRIGRVTEVRMSCSRPASADDEQWRLDARVGGGGLFLDLGSHMLDLVEWLLGPLHGVKGLATRTRGRAAGAAPSSRDVEDNVRLVFATEGGALGSASWNFASSSLSEDEVRIVGERGHLAFAVFDNGPITLVTTTKGKGQEKEEEVVTPIGPFESPAHVHQPLVAAATKDIQAFLASTDRKWPAEAGAEAGAACCRSTGGSALAASEAMDAALQGYYGGSRDDAFWLRPETWGNAGGGGDGGKDGGGKRS